MAYYLAEWTGAGTKADPFRPVGSDQPGWSAIDIRPDASRADGGGLNACLLHVPEQFEDPRAKILSEDRLEHLGAGRRLLLTDRLRVDLPSGIAFRDAAAAILLKPKANAWKPLRRGRRGYRIWLGGLLWEKRLPPLGLGPGADPFDEFTRADEATLAAPWLEAWGGGTMRYELVGNVARKKTGNTGDYLAVYDGAAVTADQWSRITLGEVTSTCDLGAMVRVDRDGPNNAYAFLTFGPQEQIAKWVSGSFSLLAEITVSDFVEGDRCRVRVEGSSIEVSKNATVIGAQTDTDISAAGHGAGMFIYNAYDELAETITAWGGGDLGTSPDMDSVSVPTLFDSASGLEVDFSAGNEWDELNLTEGYIPVGALVLAMFYTGFTDPNITGFSDLAGNTWNLIGTPFDSAQDDQVAFAWTQVETALTEADCIEVNYDDSPGARLIGHAVMVFSTPGPATLEDWSFAAKDSFPEAPVDSGDVTAPAEDCLVVGMTAVRATSAYTASPTADFTEVVDIQDTDVPDAGIYCEYAVVGPGTYASTPAFSADKYWRSLAAVFSFETEAEDPEYPFASVTIR